MFSPSQVCVGGNSKKSRETIRRSIITTQSRVRNLTFRFTVRITSVLYSEKDTKTDVPYYTSYELFYS
jgi:hypothetical protein